MSLGVERKVDMQCFICGESASLHENEVFYDSHALGPYCDACWDDVVLSIPVDNDEICPVCLGDEYVCAACVNSVKDCTCGVPWSVDTITPCHACARRRLDLEAGGDGPESMVNCPKCFSEERICTRCDKPLSFCDCQGLCNPDVCDVCDGEGEVLEDELEELQNFLDEAIT